MSDVWNWANLSKDQLEKLADAEKTLGADYLLAYQKNMPASASSGQLHLRNVRVAPLNESQIECLQGLESQLKSVVVAYQTNP